MHLQRASVAVEVSACLRRLTSMRDIFKAKKSTLALNESLYNSAVASILRTWAASE